MAQAQIDRVEQWVQEHPEMAIVARRDIAAPDIGAVLLRVVKIQGGNRDSIEETHSFPVAALAVKPERVLRWSNEPDRTNSLKRFIYMMGWRAIPLTCAGIDDTEALQEALARNAVNFGRPTRPTIDMAVGKALGLQPRPPETDQDYIIRTGSIAVGPARMNIWYQPPADKSAQRSLHEFVKEADQT